MTEPTTPKAWANTLTAILNAAYQDDRFPVDVKRLALNFSLQKYPNDPITDVLGENLPGYDGGLYSADVGKNGWGIIYNNAITSTGRINFTIAHEFGHYLLHRHEYPDGFLCGDEDMASWDSEYGKIESEANDFAATLLMPLDDFRKQISPSSSPSINDLGICANRYEVSLLASILRWLQYTSKRAMLVVSTEGYVLWARSSKTALKSGLFIKTAKRPPVEIPAHSLAAKKDQLMGCGEQVEHKKHVWLNEPCTEEVLFSDQYDFTVSLLHFLDSPERYQIDEEPIVDAVDKFRSLNR